MRKVVGLDISLQETAVCVMERDGHVIWQGKITSEPGPLVDKLNLWADEIDIVGLEACPLADYLHRGLVAANFNAVCIETRHAQRFLSTRPVKTDKNDAHGIAQMMRLGHFRPVHVKTAEAQIIRTTLQARRQVVDTLIQFQNTIRGLLRAHGLKMGEVTRLGFEERVRPLVEPVPALTMAVEPLLRVLQQVREERARFDKLLGQAARKDTICHRLMTIPGVGPYHRPRLPGDDRRPDAVYLVEGGWRPPRMTPRIYQSGETERSGQISKTGDRMLRTLLYEAASALMARSRKPSKLRSWGAAIARRRGFKPCAHRRRTQARRDHASHVGHRRPVRDRGGGPQAAGSVGGRLVPTSLRTTAAWTTGPASPLTSPCTLPGGARAARLDGRLSRTPSWGGLAPTPYRSTIQEVVTVYTGTAPPRSRRRTLMCRWEPSGRRTTSRRLGAGRYAPVPITSRHWQRV